MGAYHTLSLELQRKFTLTKENWDAIALERVEEACDSGIHLYNLTVCACVCLYDLSVSSSVCVLLYGLFLSS